MCVYLLTLCVNILMLLVLFPSVVLSYPTASSLMCPTLSKLPPLHYSAYMGELEEVERLLATGEAKIEGGKREKAAPLEVITELLFAAGADPYIADKYGELRDR